MAKFRKKPVVIEAVQFTGENILEILTFTGNQHVTFELVVKTLEGDMKANIGDWVIKGVNEEFYPCKPDIFAKTYEPVIE